MILELILVFISSCFLVWVYLLYAIKKDLVDKPNHRSSHTSPTPRGGGIVFPIVLIAYLMLAYLRKEIDSYYIMALIPSCVFIASIGFLDDCVDIKARWRFLVQIIAVVFCLIVIHGFPFISLGFRQFYIGYWGFFIASIGLLWSINLYNFMDGIDGLAAVEALFIFGFGGYFIFKAGGYALAEIIWITAASVAGFLVWNKPQAKIFMGDAGSTILGFLVMLFALMGENLYHVSILLWLILYGVFGFDASITLIRRIVSGEKYYQAHRLHAFQRLQLLGWDHKQILFRIILINSLLTVIAFCAYYYPRYLLALSFASLGVLTLLYILVEIRVPMYPNKVEKI
jgi:Fuc2NAc and GlcNAc transferase